jgi:hypothetical protein
MSEMPRLLVLDLLETYARERDIDVQLERRHARNEWVCGLTNGDRANPIRGVGSSAREAILSALRQAGVALPD